MQKFLKIEGVRGDSKAFGHEDEIELISWHWGIHRPSRGLSPTDKATVDHVTFTHQAGQASAGLLSLLLQNKCVDVAILSMRSPHEQPVESMSFARPLLPPNDNLTLRLFNTMVMSIEPHASDFGHYELVSLSFSGFEHETRARDATTGKPLGIASVRHMMSYV
jgi:type VI protein secretion system component Hcp